MMLKFYILCVFFICTVICFLSGFRKEKGIHIIRSLNDEDNIEARLRLAMLKYNEILVVDSGSSDDTLEIVKRMVKDYETIRLEE